MARKLVDVVGSLLTALLVFGATPTVLITLVGDPLGQGLGHEWSHGGRIALAGLAAVTWLAWAACSWQLTRSVVAQVRRGEVDDQTGGMLSNRITGRIAGGVLSLIALTTPLALTVGAGATGTRDVTASTAPSAVAAPAAATTGPVAVATGAATYVVRPGDSLWSIAATQLGDGDDWTAIAALNLGHAMSDGLQFIDPNRIYAGWTLDLPDPHPVPAAAPAAPAAAAPVAPVAPVAPISTVAEARAHGEPPALPLSVREAPTPATTPARADSLAGAGSARTDLPELAALGIGAIACAALARRSRRMRLLRHMEGERPEGGPTPPHSASAIDVDILLARLSGVPALRAFEVAHCRLAGALADAGRSGPPPAIRAICVGAAGVDYWLAQPGQPAPPGFTLAGHGQLWRTPHTGARCHEAAPPFMPIVLPVGEDDDGTWLVPLGRGSCLPLLGEAGADLWRAARAAQESWSWADMVVVTDDIRTATREAQFAAGDGSGPAAPQVLFFGDPSVLHDTLLANVSVITLSQAPASDVTILVDRTAASIHPLGRTVRPYLMAEATSSLVTELVSPPAASPGTQAHPESIDDLPDPPRPVAGAGESRPAVGADRVGIDLPRIGQVDVRLLTPTPRLDGLGDPLPPNRARRAVELVSYLALHREDDVTSDRLRTRVLGSADADAASKTLFNIAAAARRAMGVDADGTPLLPPGSRTGHYRVSEAVTVDVHRAASLAAEGSAAEDPDLAMTLLHTALALVEGEPLANALSGYTWWEAEGHGARVAAVLVNAANVLAALAVDAGRFDLAQWGLAQARLVDPYSEALSRTAMQVAAAAGDADRLRREWRECQRRIDELDPGSTPSSRTERLYGELTQRVLVGFTGTRDQ